MEVIQLPIGGIKPYAGNPRKIGDKAVGKVAESLRAYGWRQPIVVDADKVIVVGHTRYLAAKKLKMKDVPVHVAHDMTAEQAKAYRIADNRTATETEFDFDMLRLEMLNLPDLGPLGFDPDELATILQVKDLPDDTTVDAHQRTTSKGLGNPIIQYQLIFETEAQQAVWFDFLRYLKSKVPGKDTAAARLAAFISEQNFVTRP